jgi:hypothetical protein
LARYQAQIDAWIAELAQDQARTQADILTLEEKIKLEEEARDTRLSNLKYSGDAIEAVPGTDSMKTSKEVAVKIAEKAGVSPRKCYSYFEFERLHLRRSS